MTRVAGPRTGDDSAQGQAAYAQWNFDFYAHSNGASYMIDLLWDTDPAFGTDASKLGHFKQLLAPGGTIQDSWNLGMSFIDTGAVVLRLPFDRNGLPDGPE